MKNKIIFLLILLIAVFLRFYKLGSIPSSYTPDELAQGYTAYSILETGKDEWGNINIFNLRSYGDYKPPIQTLLMMPFIKAFGLSPFTVRLPNALFSVLTIISVYLLTQFLFKNKKTSLLSSFFMAVSSFIFPISRIALEANLLIFFLTTAIYLFLSGLKNKNYFRFIISFIFFWISLFTYHSTKVFLPLFFFITFFYLKIYKKKTFLIIFLITVFSIFFSQFLISRQIDSARTGDIIILNPTDNWQAVADSQYEITKNGLPYPITKLFNNKLVYLAKRFTHNYFSYFSPQFLITNGAGETTYGMIPGFGILGYIATLGVFLFIFLLLRGKIKGKDKNNTILLLLLILISPIAAALAKGSYSANRISIIAPFIQILAAYGLISFFSGLKKFKKPITLILSLLFIIESLIFIQKYFYQANQILSHGMLYGHQQAIDYINKNYPQANVIYSRKLSEPQAYVNFFNKIPPHQVQLESKNWLEFQKRNLSFLDQLGEYKINNYTFKEISFHEDSQIKNTILVGRPEEFLGNKVDHTIFYPSFSQNRASILIYINDNHLNNE